MSDRGKKWLRRAGTAVLLLLVIGFIACRWVGSIFRAKLAAYIEKEFHAELLTGAVIYRPPFTLIARDARVIRRESDGSARELLRAQSLDVSLSGIPYEGQPVPVREIVLDQPSFFLKEGEAPLPLDRVRLTLHARGSDQYECELEANRSGAAEVKATASLDQATNVCQIHRLTAGSDLAQVATAFPWPEKVQKQLAAAAPAGKLLVAGSGTLPLKDPRHASYHLTADLSAISVRLERWKHSLDDGAGRLLITNASADSGPWGAVNASVDHFSITAGKARFELRGGKLIALLDRKAWQAAGLIGTMEVAEELPVSLERTGWFFEQGKFKGLIEFTAAGSGPFKLPLGQSPMEAFEHVVLAYPRGMLLKPKNWRTPITNITGGPIACRGGVVTLSNLSGTCGQDKLLLNKARLTLWDPARQIKLDDLRKQIKFEEIAGTVIFHGPEPGYPNVVGKTIRELRPTGPFSVGGGSWYAINLGPGRKLKPDFFIDLMTEGGAFTVTPRDVPLIAIHGEATIAPLTVNIRDFKCQVAGGTGWAQGKISPGKPFLYDGRIELRNIDLRELAARLDLKEPARSRLSGEGYAAVHVTGAGPGGPKTPEEAFAADGEVQVLHGDFGAVSPVGTVAAQVKKPADLGVGDAAAVFRIANQTINVDSAAVNSPLVGLQGTGTVGFNGSLNLTVVGAPLGDWRDKMRQAKIPVVDDILGAIQKLFDSVQGTLFYQYRVTGTIAHPDTQLVPAPVISDPLKLLFGQMLRENRNDQLLTDVRATTQKSQPPKR